jgi:hypothetical protein
LFSGGERWVSAANVGGKYVVPGSQNRGILGSSIRDLEVHGYIIVKEKLNG